MSNYEKNRPIVSAHPIHPGIVLKLEVLPARNVSGVALAEAIKTPRPTVTRILNGKHPITPHMAARIEAAIGYPATLLLKLQLAHDLAVVREEEAERLASIPRIAA